MKKLYLLACLSISISFTNAQEIVLVKGIPSDVNLNQYSSNPKYFSSVNGQGLFFTQFKNTTSSFEHQPIQIWKTDTTEEGTVLLKDLGINMVSNSPYYKGISNVINLGHVLYFTEYNDYISNGSCGIGSYSNADQYQIVWRTDGTAEGTFPIATFEFHKDKPCLEIASYTGEDFHGLDTINKHTFAYTAKGIYQVNPDTVIVLDTFKYATPNQLVNQYGNLNGGRVLFTANEIWYTNGTDTGTYPLTNFEAVDRGFIGITNGHLYFYYFNGSSYEIWKTDGTKTGTSQVSGLNTISDIQYFASLEGQRFYSITDDIYGQEVWFWDSLGNFNLMADANMATGDADPLKINDNVDEPLIYYLAYDSDGNYQLWESDGTAQGTIQLTDFANETSNYYVWGKHGDKILFTASDYASYGHEPHVASPDTFMLLMDINQGTNHSYMSGLYQLDSLFVFKAQSDLYGTELFRTDLTTEGTGVLKDLRPGTISSGVQNMNLVDSILYFTATTDSDGMELFRTNGTTNGTYMVQDLYTSGSSSPSDFHLLGDKLIFSAGSDSFGSELFYVQTIEDTIYLLKDFAPGIANSFFSQFKQVDDKLFFYTNSQYWVTDGTAINTKALGNYVNPTYMGKDDNDNHVFYYTAQDEYFAVTPALETIPYEISNLGVEGISGKLRASNSPDGLGIELYYDWHLLKDINKGNLEIEGMLETNDHLLIKAKRSQDELWSSGGFENNTMKIQEGYYYGTPGFLDSMVLFGFNKGDGTEIAYFDGEAIDTVLDSWPGNNAGAYIVGVYPDSSKAVFRMLGEDGYEFWESDGTKENTYRLVSMDVDSFGMTVYGNKVYPNSDSTWLFIDNTRTNIGLYQKGQKAKSVQALNSYYYRAERIGKYLLVSDQIAFNDVALRYTDGTAGNTGLLFEHHRAYELMTFGDHGLILARTDTNYNIYHMEASPDSITLVFSTPGLSEVPTLINKSSENRLFFSLKSTSGPAYQKLYFYDRVHGQLDTLVSKLDVDNTNLIIKEAIVKDSMVYFAVVNEAAKIGNLYALDVRKDSLSMMEGFSYPRHFQEANENIYFIAKDIIHGDALWAIRYNKQPAFEEKSLVINTCGLAPAQLTMPVTDEDALSMSFSVFSSNEAVAAVNGISLQYETSQLEIEAPVLSAGNTDIIVVAHDHLGETDTLTIQLVSRQVAHTILPVLEACEGEETIIFGESRVQAGLYHDTIPDSFGCDSILTQELVVHPLHLTDMGAENICSGDSLLIFGEYKAIPGVYYDTLTSIHGCDSVISIELMVHGPEMTSLPTIEICNGDSAMIHGIYQKHAGVFHDTLTTIHGCDSIVSIELVVVKPGIQLELDGQTLIAESTNTSYQWKTCDGNSVAGETSQTFSPGESGNYLVEVTKNGCKSVSSCMDVEIAVNSAGLVHQEMKVYPNPTPGLLHLQSISAKGTVTVINSSGLVVLEERTTKDILSLDLSFLPEGIYLVKYDHAGETKMEKVVKY